MLTQEEHVELTGTPWREKVLLLNDTLPHSDSTRGVIAETDDQAHLIEGIDGVLRRLGGTARRWRFDRMSTVVDGKDSPGGAQRASVPVAGPTQGTLSERKPRLFFLGRRPACPVASAVLLSLEAAGPGS